MFEMERTASDSVFDAAGLHGVIQRFPTVDLTRIRKPTIRSIKSSSDDECFLTPTPCTFQKMSFDNL